MPALLQLSVVSLLFLFRTGSIVSSQKSVFYFFYQRPSYPRDCKEALDLCHSERSSGVYVIRPDGYHKPFEVFCDNTVDSGGWTVILRRHDGSITFQRDWLEYKRGFGFLSQELWLGHEKLSFLTNQKIYELRIDFTYSDGTSIYALYRFFRLSDDFSNYKLSSVGLFAGTVDFTKCPTNMKYGTCLCQSSCGNLQDCQPCPQDEGCFCPSGFYLRGTDCVTQEECGCFIDGDTIREGQTYTSPGCSKRCTCTSGQLDCNNNYQCSPNAVCETRNNVLQCYCNPGYTGDGVTCVSICQANRVFGTCPCERTCGNPQVCGSCTQGQPCYCPSGFYIQGQTCVREEDCGCFTDGMIIPEGQTYTSPGCSKRCTCTSGQLDCNNNYQCSPNAVCETRNNVLQCYCNPGYTGDGVTCVSICQANRVFGTCPCERTCGNPQVCGSCTQGQPCYCPSGFYIQGQTCVREEDCGCFNDGMIIPEGQTYTSPGCSKRCTCTSGQLDCNNNYQCSPNAVCETRNNVLQCYCNPGYTGDGVTCVSICQANRVFGTCPCERTCGNPQVCGSCTQGQPCYCPSGFYIQGQTCVREEDCGCFTDGMIIPEGQTYTSPGCSKRCTCTNGQLDCNNNYQCSPNAVCETRDNVLQCYCNPGYTGDGVTCVSICQANRVFGTCTCERTCGNPQVCGSCTQGQPCYCPSGFYIQGQNCVREEDCGCFTDGMIIPNGDSYVNTDCSQMCSCSNDQLICNSYQCSPNAECREENGVRQCICTEGYEGDGETCTILVPTDCNDVQNAGNTRSDVYSIRPTGWTGSPFDVFCNMTIDGGGWTVFQRRVDGTTDFYRNWNSYRDGFGDIQNEFWLGNEKLHYLTQQATYEYRLDFVTSSYSSYHNKYSRFRVDNESNKYRVTDVGSRSGTRGYSLHNTQNRDFSTHDQDNDGSSYDCADKHRSGWWHGGYYYYYCFYSYCHLWPDGSRYRACSYSNLNGDYNGGNGQNIFSYYYYCYSSDCQIKYTEMKIRRIS